MKHRSYIWKIIKIIDSLPFYLIWSWRLLWQFERLTQCDTMTLHVYLHHIQYLIWLENKVNNRPNFRSCMEDVRICKLECKTPPRQITIQSNMKYFILLNLHQLIDSKSQPNTKSIKNHKSIDWTRNATN